MDFYLFFIYPFNSYEYYAYHAFSGHSQKYTINCVIAERPDTKDILAMVRSIHIKSINK